MQRSSSKIKMTKLFFKETFGIEIELNEGEGRVADIGRVKEQLDAVIDEKINDYLKSKINIKPSGGCLNLWIYRIPMMEGDTYLVLKGDSYQLLVNGNPTTDTEIHAVFSEIETLLHRYSEKIYAAIDLKIRLNQENAKIVHINESLSARDVSNVVAENYMKGIAASLIIKETVDIPGEEDVIRL